MKWEKRAQQGAIGQFWNSTLSHTTQIQIKVLYYKAFFDAILEAI